MIYKLEYSGSRIKYGYTRNIENRNQQYITHTGDLVDRVLEFHENLDRVDEACIHLYLENILHLKPLGGSREVYQNPGDLEVIDSDTTLEKFYRYLKDIGFGVGSGGKIKAYLQKRLQAVYELFDFPETSKINPGIVKTVSRLFESLYLNETLDLSENIFLKAKVDPEYMDYIMSLDLCVRDILDIWFKGDWRKVK